MLESKTKKEIRLSNTIRTKTGVELKCSRREAVPASLVTPVA